MFCLSRLFVFSAFCLFGTLACTGAPHESSGSLQINGRTYLRLNDWAHSHDLQVRSGNTPDAVQVYNSAARILLTVDSRDAQFDGVSLLLSLPVAARMGAWYIAQTDAQYAFEPLLNQKKAAGRKTVRTVCLDPGHGGKDPGNHSGPNQEKKYTLLLSQELRTLLTKAGFHVIMTRTADRFVDLEERPNVARRAGADLFVSLHFNAAPSSAATVHGAEVYCLTPPGAESSNVSNSSASQEWVTGNRFNSQSLVLAFQVQKRLGAAGIEDRGVKRARFVVLKNAAMPAILVEGGFMSHPAEGKKIFDANHRRQIARAVADGIVSFARMAGSDA